MLQASNPTETLGDTLSPTRQTWIPGLQAALRLTTSVSTLPQHHPEEWYTLPKTF